MNSLDVTLFPAPRDQVAARWHAVQIEPVPTSGERLTVGVVAISDQGFVVMPAPGLERLHSLYDKYADAVLGAASLSLEALNSFLEKSVARNLEEFHPPFLSVHLGAPRSATGQTLDAIAEQALRLSSSLSLSLSRRVASRETVYEMASKPERPVPQDPLTREVRGLVVRVRPGLAEAFDRRLPTKVVKRAPRIGFVSSATVANFNAMKPKAIPQSFQKLRNSFWGLLLHRDLETLFKDTDHRVYLHRPRDDDPRCTVRQIDNVAEACAEAEFEAARQSINVSIVHGADEIATQILRVA